MHRNHFAQKSSHMNAQYYYYESPFTTRLFLSHLPKLSVCVRAQSLQSCPTLLQPHGLQPAKLLCPWDSPGKNTRLGCHGLLQGIFQTQESNWCLLHLLHCRWILYPLSHVGINRQLLCYLPVSCSLHSMNSSKPPKLTGYLVRQTGKIGVHKNNLYPHRLYILTFVGKEGRQIIKQRNKNT